MTLQEYIKYALDKKRIEYHSFGGPATHYQCVDLANDYITKVWGLKAIIGTDAKDFHKKLSDGMEFVKNTIDYLPSPGELPIWSGRVGGGAGHIAITTEKGKQTTFKSLDQNWSKKQLITLESHNYNNVLGFIRKKGNVSKTYTEAEWQLERDERDKNRNLYQEELKKHEKTTKQLMELVNTHNKCVDKKEFESMNKANGQLVSQLETEKKVSAGYKGQVTKKETEIAALQAQLDECKTNQPTTLDRFTSRKFILALLALIVPIANQQLGWELSAPEVLAMLTPLLAFMGVEGYTDHKVRMEKVDSGTKSAV